MIIFCCLPGGQPTHSAAAPYLRTWTETRRLLLTILSGSVALFITAWWHHRSVLASLGAVDYWAGLPALVSASYLGCAGGMFLLGARPAWDPYVGVTVSYERLRLFLNLSVAVGVAGAVACLVFGLARYGGGTNAAAVPLYVSSGACAIVVGVTVWLWPTDPREEGARDEGSGFAGAAKRQSRYAPPPVVVGEAV